MKTPAIRVLVADDHPIVVEGIRRHIAHVDDVEFTGGVRSVDEAVSFIQTHEVDVAVMDVQMPGVEGADSIRPLVDGGVPIVLFTLRSRDALVGSLVAGGASAFVSKSAPTSELIDAIRVVHCGGQVLTPSLLAPAGVDEGPPHRRLTQREHDVFLLLAKCMTPKEAAFQMGVSPSTVYTHADRVRRKLGVATLPEVVQYAKDWAIPLE